MSRPFGPKKARKRGFFSGFFRNFLRKFLVAGFAGKMGAAAAKNFLGGPPGPVRGKIAVSPVFLKIFFKKF